LTPKGIIASHARDERVSVLEANSIGNSPRNV
jgi:hypothetical protein